MVWLFALLCLLAVVPATAQEMRGHGGPVRALAVTSDGAFAISGSFDSAAIVWSLDSGAAVQVLRFHDGAVNAVAALPGRRFATAGEDGRIAVWQAGRAEPVGVLTSRAGPVAALAVSPDGASIAAAFFDGTAGIFRLEGGEPTGVSGQRGPLSAVAFSADGRRLVTASHDLTLRITPLDGGAARPVEVGIPVSALAVAGDGEIMAAGADGKVRFFSAEGADRGAIAASDAPLIALALSPDGRQVAASSVSGSVALIQRLDRKVERVLVGPGLPVWALAWRPGSPELLTGGGDRVVRRWNAATGEHVGPVAMGRPDDPLARYRGERGADVFRACIACHTLDAADGPRAGPTLAGVISRHIATAPGYPYSPALRGMSIVWTKETISRLFEIGPNRYTPGTKMPDQIVADPDDRKALVDFIARVGSQR